MAKQTKNSSGRGQRDLKVKVKSARGRTVSQVKWLQRQLNDPYVKRAKAEGYRGRAAFKILELDEKFRFLVPGARWLIWAVRRWLVSGCGETRQCPGRAA